ncbi:hypothetical protein JY651_41810 [Pyxidicoccus parkwayensis]|uniref:Lipoprotein n=1 Tax=Pyxidicoccus parkwayensis TaxID=2813578 RepID=A0ABX7NRX3_9BACT|nr:hypothetical protein [Pyxidicoccus parkwaysis]QSQ21641.1 hypothetical protein JY651_41810 [Pyxidicoccus parkwaysis]
MLPTRPAWALVLAYSIALSGCDDDPQPTPTADAGTEGAWDGGYTVLEEHGDYTEDPGVLAPCSFLPAVGTTPDTCPEPSQFDLSACNRASLGSLPRDGKYRLLVRQEIPLEDGGSRGSAFTTAITLRSDGGPDTLADTLITSKVQEGGDFRLYTETLQADGGSNRHLFLGCQVTAPDRFTGCWGRCVNGRVRARATFDAYRMTWPNGNGEPESSGGLDLVSESYVAQGLPVDIYVAKEHAYVVSIHFASRPGKAGGLTVFDVKDRKHPVLKKVISLPADNYWNGVWAKGDALYVASESTGIVVFDISDPGNPAFVRSVPSGAAPLNIHTVLVDGDRLYGMAPSPEGSTFVFDVSRPLEPVLSQKIHFPPTASYDGPHDAFAYGGRLYINHTSAGYYVADVSNLEDVKLLGSYAYANSFSHHNAVGTFAGRTIAFEGAEGPGTHLRVLDVTDPAHIVKIGEYKKRPVTSIHNMLLVGSRLYIAWYHEGVRVLDVSNPTRPHEVAHFNTFRETDPERSDDTYEGAMGIRVPGDGYVYAVDTSRGLMIFKQP